MDDLESVRRNQELTNQLVDRRGFLSAASLLLLVGCAQERSARLPDVAWPAGTPGPEPIITRAPTTATPTAKASMGAIPRSRWATAAPKTNLMQRMLPVRNVTIHHDGMTVFTESSEAATIRRLESIRHYHQISRGWGDIGYHFAVDRAGRVWEARPLAWQGAHVKDHNEGNVGIVALGNFDEQSPTDVQVEAVRTLAAALMQQSRLSPGELRTHQEWAPTACPGRNMQRRVVALRSSGAFA
ncbi:MAG: peptidoglycan recognition protein family protein [Phycisphaerales bacterium]